MKSIDVKIINENIEDYCEAHTTTEDELLQALVRETNLKTLMPRMICGNMQGRLLTMLVQLIQPKNVLEIGTFTGYSAICIARGLTQSGKLTTIDNNPEIEDIARKYFTKCRLENKIHFIIDDALHAIPQLNVMFDMVYIDADKHHLHDYYHLAMEKLNKKGVILIDNILWNGKVVNTSQHDSVSQKIRDFNEMVQSDACVENLLLPLRDGVMLIKKK